MLDGPPRVAGLQARPATGGMRGSVFGVERERGFHHEASFLLPAYFSKSASANIRAPHMIGPSSQSEFGPVQGLFGLPQVERDRAEKRKKVGISRLQSHSLHGWNACLPEPARVSPPRCK